jgi:hypothetical protein
MKSSAHHSPDLSYSKRNVLKVFLITVQDYLQTVVARVIVSLKSETSLSFQSKIKTTRVSSESYTVLHKRSTQNSLSFIQGARKHIKRM